MTATQHQPSLLRHRDVALLWSSGLVSWVGSYAMFVALPVVVYERTDSPLATAFTVLGGAIPSVVVSQWAGVVADRVDRRRLMVRAGAAMAGLTLGYLLITDGPWWWLALLNFLTSCVGQLIGPAEHALLPELVEAERLGEAASLNALNNNIARLLGPALGGLLYAQAGWSATVILNAGAYLVAALLVQSISSSRARTPEPAQPRSLRLEWVEGVLLVCRSSGLRALLLVLVLVMFGEGFVSALLAPLVGELIGGGASTLGWILSAQAIGGIAGAAWATRVADRHDPFRLLAWAALGAGVLLVAVFNYALAYPRVWPAIVLTALAGGPFAVFASAQLQALQLLSPVAVRGRVFALSWGVMGLAQLVGIGLAGVLGESWGALVINVDAATYLLAGVIALVLTRHPRRDRSEIEGSRRVRLTRRRE